MFQHNHWQTLCLEASSDPCSERMNVHLNCNDEQLLVPLISQANTFQIALNYFNLLQILSLLSVLVHPGYLARPIVGTKTEITYEAETKYNILRLIFFKC